MVQRQFHAANRQLPFLISVVSRYVWLNPNRKLFVEVLLLDVDGEVEVVSGRAPLDGFDHELGAACDVQFVTPRLLDRLLTRFFNFANVEVFDLQVLLFNGF